MEREFYEIQIVKRYKIRKIGMPMALLGGLMFLVFVFSTVNRIHYNNEEVFLISGVCFALVLLGLIIHNIKRYENAQIQFLPEGVIMKSKAGFIPIKYGKIKRIPISDFSHDSTKSYFYLYVEDSRKYEIKIDTEIYDVLLEMFPFKNNS